MSEIKRKSAKLPEESGNGAIVQEPFAQLPSGYAELLDSLKKRIRESRVKAALSVNRELVLLYWQIGQEILERQREEGWGARVIDRLAKDLRREFPEMKGFSARNLLFMRGFAEAYPDEAMVKQLVSQIPWGHIIRLLQNERPRGAPDTGAVTGRAGERGCGG